MDEIKVLSEMLRRSSTYAPIDDFYAACEKLGVKEDVMYALWAFYIGKFVY
jgi:hypothetical protein